MTILLLIRHGENDALSKHIMPGRAPGLHLNQAGREQAQTLADAFREAKITAIYSSPLERAVETAEPLALAKKLQVQIEPGLIEPDIGRWKGRSYMTLSKSKVWQMVQRSPSRFRFPDGESFAEAQARVAVTLERLLNAHRPDAVIACFSHGDIIKLAVAHLIGLPLDHFNRLGVDTGSVTMLDVREDRARLWRLNQHPPLDLPDAIKTKKQKTGR